MPKSINPLKTTLSKGLLLSLGALFLCSCATEAEIAAANKIVTATETEVIGCTFLGNVDTGARGTINSARFELKLDVSALGGTHLVETHAYSALIGFYPDFGVALSGRAYLCPEGKGPIVSSKKAFLETPTENLRIYEGIHD